MACALDRLDRLPGMLPRHAQGHAPIRSIAQLLDPGLSSSRNSRSTASRTAAVQGLQADEGHRVGSEASGGGTVQRVNADPTEILMIEISEWRIVDDDIWFAVHQRFVKQASGEAAPRRGRSSGTAI
jgi:hypothetical protein